MSETTPQAKDRLPANVMALQRQLEEMASRTKAKPAEERREVQGPVLVIRGK